MNLLPSHSEMILHDPALPGWLYFRHAVQVWSIQRLEEVLPALVEIEHSAGRQGLAAAGFLAYEAAGAFDPALRTHPAQDSRLPLLWFGLYPQPEQLPEEAVPTQDAAQDAAQEAALPEGWQAEVDEASYRQAIDQVKTAIANGETYQVNYTYRLRTSWEGKSWPLFCSLARAHQAPYAAFLETEDWSICSISPELFFRLEGSSLSSRPMKGTAQRGRTLDEDRRLAEWLQHSEKNRAENVMIVDMVRNDLGRIARTGSVNVPILFEVEKYPTVWQMTSTVQAETQASMVEILGALFPAASITGAPKVRTMQIIAGLENSPRGVYTGAIGYFEPGRSALFNVAIRTLVLDRQRRQAEYGVGGGIVWDSQAEAEWEETHAKARVLYEMPQPFELLETLAWKPGEGWALLPQHLERLQRSADYFDFDCDLESAGRALAQLADRFEAAPQRVRLLLSKNGALRLEHQPLSTQPPYTQIGLAKTPIQSTERFLYHKTTRRGIYQKALEARPGFKDVLLWNERGEATESCIANLVVEQDGQWYTPRLACGLLPGIYRAWLLEQGKVREKVIRLEELARCEHLYLVNSVRGMWEVELLEHV